MLKTNAYNSSTSNTGVCGFRHDFKERQLFRFFNHAPNKHMSTDPMSLFNPAQARSMSSLSSSV